MVEIQGVALRLKFFAGHDFVLERYISDAKQRTDRQDFAAVDPVVVDIGSVGRVQVGDPNLVGGQFDQAVRPGNRRSGDNDVRWCRSSDFQAVSGDDIARRRQLSVKSLETMDLIAFLPTHFVGPPVKLRMLVFLRSRLGELRFRATC